MQDGTAKEVNHEIGALHALLDAQLEAVKDNLEGVHRAIEAAPVAQKAAVDTAMAAAEKAVNAALLAAKSAVDAAAFAHAREHELMAEALRQQQLTYTSDRAQQNEWRGAVNDIAAQKMDSREVRTLLDGVDLRTHSMEVGFDNRLKSVEQELATTRGTVTAQKSAIQTQMWIFGAVVSILSTGIAVVSFILSHSN